MYFLINVLLIVWKMGSLRLCCVINYLMFLLVGSNGLLFLNLIFVEFKLETLKHTEQTLSIKPLPVLFVLWNDAAC